ncbi:hypothetical protein G6011_08576 [Alternaria panax]|uniref:Fork-head domain-containing protein n=1 Tax=Alternaria panax TaxID=48097 RepID=A0AAD4FK89_9PLEO|nr:hypothetical protein G6011_08576 [Alternaria panax]
MSSDRLAKTKSDTHVKPEPVRLSTNATTADKLIKPKKASGPPQPPAPKLLERTEIPNTPSQGSSQIENSIPEKPSGSFPDVHISQQYHYVPGDKDALTMEPLTNAQSHTPSTTLCSTCQKQSMLTRPEEKGVQWSSCRIRTRAAETVVLEIPETPNVDNRYNALSLPTSSAGSIAHHSVPRLDKHEPAMASSTQESPMTAAKPDSATLKAIPLSRVDLDSERAKILPETRKVCDEEPSCISTAEIEAADTAATSHEDPIGKTTRMDVDSVADMSEQMTALTAEQSLQENPTCDNAAVPRIDTQRESCTPPVKKPHNDEPSRTFESCDTHSDSPNKSDTFGESEPLKPSIAVSESIGMSTDILSKQSSAECTIDRIVPISSDEQQAPTVLQSKETTEGVRSLSDPNVSMSPALASTSSPEPNKPLNTRDLARIALVCARGTALTALQVIDWLASRFSYLQKGQGSWEKTIKSVLSLLPEIHSAKTPRQPVLYSFASAALRAENERRYQSYLPTVSVPGPQGGSSKARKSVRKQSEADTVRQHEDLQSAPPTHAKRTVTKAIKSAQSRRNVPAHESLPPLAVLEQALSHNPVSAPVTEPAEIDTSAAIPDGEKISSNPPSPSVSGSTFQGADPSRTKVISGVDRIVNPFERASASRKNITPSGGLENKRETSLRSVYPRAVAPTIETMTPEEKAAKITEIKKRPKRKQFFGSVYRLAHVRRYGRLDIHDESDGAWKPDSTTERSIAERDVAMNNQEKNRSLLEVFNLPSNAIPMNDGKELAFRDGTLVTDPTELP